MCIVRSLDVLTGVETECMARCRIRMEDRVINVTKELLQLPRYLFHGFFLLSNFRQVCNRV